MANIRSREREGRKRPTHARESDQPKVSGKRVVAAAAGGAAGVATSAPVLRDAFSKKKKRKRVFLRPIRRTPSKGAFAKKVVKKVKTNG